MGETFVRLFVHLEYGVDEKYGGLNVWVTKCRGAGTFVDRLSVTLRLERIVTRGKRQGTDPFHIYDQPKQLLPRLDQYTNVSTDNMDVLF